MLESEIQRKITKRLHNEGWLVVKIIQCSRNGWPDLQAHKDGKTVFIEVKRPFVKPTELQVYIHGLLRKQGFTVLVANNEKDLVTIL